MARKGDISVASPINKLDIAKIGALTMSEIPYFKLNHNVIRGTTKPAPKARIALVIENFSKMFFDLLERKSLMPTLEGFSFFDSLTPSIIRVDTRPRTAIEK